MSKNQHLDESAVGQPWYFGDLTPDHEVEVTADLVMTELFPWAFNAFELLRMHTEVLGLFLDAGVFSKGVRSGQLSVRDLADVGVLHRLIELAQASNVDLRELPGSYWGSTPEDRMRSPRAQRLVTLIQEASRNHSKGTRTDARDSEYSGQASR